MVQSGPAGPKRIPITGDIAKIVTHLNRRTAISRAALARDPVTVAYLEAGCRLLARQFTPSAANGDEGERSFLQWLTRDVLFEEMRTHTADPLPRQPSPGTFRDRWQSKSDFVGDLVAYVIWSRTEPADLETDRVSKQVVTASLAATIDALARQEMELRLQPRRIETFRVRIHLQPMAEADVSLREIVANTYRKMSHSWVAAFRVLMDAQGRRLCRGIRIEDLAVILTSTAEGLALRSLVEDPVGRPNVVERGRLLAVAATGLLTGCTVARRG